MTDSTANIWSHACPFCGIEFIKGDLIHSVLIQRDYGSIQCNFHECCFDNHPEECSELIMDACKFVDLANAEAELKRNKPTIH